MLLPHNHIVSFFFPSPLLHFHLRPLHFQCINSPVAAPLKLPHVYLNSDGGSRAPGFRPARFLWCFLTGQATPGPFIWRGLSAATAWRAKQHFTTMSAISTVHTNQRVCQREAQLQRRKRWKNDGRERGNRGEAECQSCSF